MISFLNKNKSSTWISHEKDGDFHFRLDGPTDCVVSRKLLYPYSFAGGSSISLRSFKILLHSASISPHSRITALRLTPAADVL